MSSQREIQRNINRRREARRQEEMQARITESVNAALLGVLPTLVNQTVEVLRSQETPPFHKSEETVYDEKPVEAIHVWLARFQKQQPLIFRSAASPVDADNWIDHIEKVFDVLGIDERYKVRLAVYKLEGEAQKWWKTLQQTKGGEYFVDMIDWAGFKELFFQQYFPAAERAAAARAYAVIKQRYDESVADFMNRFLGLVSIMGATAGLAAEQAQKFQWAVLDRYREIMISRDFNDVTEAATLTKSLEFARNELISSGSDESRKRFRNDQTDRNQVSTPMQPFRGNHDRPRSNENHNQFHRGENRNQYNHGNVRPAPPDGRVFALTNTQAADVGVEVDDKEVNSPLKISYSPELIEFNEVNTPLKVNSSPELITKSTRSCGDGDCHNQKVDSLLNSIENLVQWKTLKARPIPTSDHHKEKENMFLEEEEEIPTPDQKGKVKNDTAVTTSLSSWLVESEKLTTESKEESQSQYSTGNSYSFSAYSDGATSWKSFEDRPILGACTIDEVRQISARSSPRKSPSHNPDETPIIGTIGSYWSHTGQTTDSSNSYIAPIGMFAKSRRNRENKAISCHSSPSKKRLERVFDKAAA